MIGIDTLFYKYLIIYAFVRFGSDVLALLTWSTWSLRNLRLLFRRRTRKDHCR